MQNELDESKQEVEKAMLGEYQNFFNNFCISAEKVVTTVMAGKINKLTKENQEQQERITELEIKLKNSHQGVFDATNAEQGNEGQYDMEGNFVYANGAYYDKEGLYHDLDGKVYDANGTFIRQDENFEPKHIEVKEKQEEVEEPETDKPVDLNSLDAFDYMTDIAEKDDIYGVAEDVIKNVDSDIKVVNSGEKRTKSVEPILDETNAVENITNEEPVESANEGETQMVEMEPVDLNAESVETEKIEEKPKKKAGRPRKIVTETVQKPKGKRGRPRKVAPATTVSEPAKKKPGRPKKIVNGTATQSAQSSAKRPVGRPKKIVNEQAVQKPKGKRGRPKKNLNSIEIEEINKKITEQQNKLSEMRDNLNREFEVAMKNLDSSKIVDNETRKNELFNEIEKLKEEAKSVNSTDSESKISSINQRLEALIEEVKKLNS